MGWSWRICVSNKFLTEAEVAVWELLTRGMSKGQWFSTLAIQDILGEAGIRPDPRDANLIILTGILHVLFLKLSR